MFLSFTISELGLPQAARGVEQDREDSVEKGDIFFYEVDIWKA